LIGYVTFGNKQDDDLIFKFNFSSLECPNGGPPKITKYPMRGDWILARGPMFNVDSNSTMTDTIYAYRKKQELYECISDHAIITFDVEISA